LAQIPSYSADEKRGEFFGIQDELMGVIGRKNTDRKKSFVYDGSFRLQNI
jgi:hypothetical protein